MRRVLSKFLCAVLCAGMVFAGSGVVNTSVNAATGTGAKLVVTTGCSKYVFAKGTTHDVELSVDCLTADTTTLTYQWFKNGSAIDQACKATYLAKGVSSDTSFECVVYDEQGGSQGQMISIEFTQNGFNRNFDKTPELAVKTEDANTVRVVAYATADHGQLSLVYTPGDIQASYNASTGAFTADLPASEPYYTGTYYIDGANVVDNLGSGCFGFFVKSGSEVVNLGNQTTVTVPMSEIGDVVVVSKYTASEEGLYRFYVTNDTAWTLLTVKNSEGYTVEDACYDHRWNATGSWRGYDFDGADCYAKYLKAGECVYFQADCPKSIGGAKPAAGVTELQYTMKVTKDGSFHVAQQSGDSVAVSSLDNEGASQILDDVMNETEKMMEDSGLITYLDVSAEEMSSDDLSDTEASALEQVLEDSDMEIAEYIDLDVTMHLGDLQRPITDTLDSEIEFSVDIPEELKDEADEFSIIRIHDGNAEELDVEVKEDQIGFETSQFSTYVLVYHKKTKSEVVEQTTAEQTIAENASDEPTSMKPTIEEPVSKDLINVESTTTEQGEEGGNTPLVLWICLGAVGTLAIAGAVTFVLIYRKKKKNREDMN